MNLPWMQGHTTNIELTMGSPIGWRQLADFNTTQMAAEFLRLGTYLLKHRKARPAKQIPISFGTRKKTKTPKPIVAPIAKSRLLREIQDLPDDSRVVDQNWKLN